MKIYLATWLGDRSLGKSLTKKGGSRRLVSYHFILDQGVSTKHLRKYIKTGKADIRKKK